MVQKLQKRQSLTNKKPDNIDQGKSRMANMMVFKQHFDLLEETIDRLNLRNKPTSIFN